MTPTEWLRRFEAADACIRNIYGDEAVFQESRNVWEETLRCFLARFGDREVRAAPVLLARAGAYSKLYKSQAQPVRV